MEENDIYFGVDWLTKRNVYPKQKSVDNVPIPFAPLPDPNKVYGPIHLPVADVVFKPEKGAVRYMKDYEKKYPYTKEEYGSEENYNNLLKEYVSNKVASDLGIDKRDVLKINTLPILDQMYLQTNPKYQTTYGDDLVEALKTFGKSMKYSTRILPGLVEAERIGQIKNASYLTELEKWQKIQEYKNSPWASRLGDMFGVLAPASIPGKLIQSIYKDGYGPLDALSGVKNISSMTEDIFTDPFIYKSLFKSGFNAMNAVNNGMTPANAYLNYTLPTAIKESNKALVQEGYEQNRGDRYRYVPNLQGENND